LKGFDIMSQAEAVLATVQSIREGTHERIRMGAPERFSEAASVGDYGDQGDLRLTIVESTPSGFVFVKKPKAIDRQLVPGNTEGAKHCLDSLDGVELNRPAEWGPDYVGLLGPCLKLTKERTIQHPTHGDVTIPAGFTIQCRYQREWDAEQRRERRNAD
jgi:hypothetical protein